MGVIKEFFTFWPKSEEFHFYSSLLGPKVKNKVFLRFFELFFTFLNYSSLLVQKVKNIQKFFTFKFNVTVLMRWDVWIRPAQRYKYLDQRFFKGFSKLNLWRQRIFKGFFSFNLWNQRIVKGFSKLNLWSQRIFKGLAQPLKSKDFQRIAAVKIKVKPS